MSKLPVIQYRRAVVDDIQFIITTWIDAYKTAHGAGLLLIDPLDVPCACGRVVHYDFASVMGVTLANLLQRPGLTTWVAYDPRAVAPYDLYGYIVSETGANMPSYRGAPGEVGKLEVVESPDPLVHFVFVKRHARGCGIARALFKAAGIDPAAPWLYSCKTSNVARLERAGLMPKARWFPLSARFSKAPRGERKQKP